MALSPMGGPVPGAGAPKPIAPLSVLASLFFMWGFLAYFVASIPSAKLIERTGYKRSIAVGLLAMAAGALMMAPSAQILSYGVGWWPCS